MSAETLEFGVQELQNEMVAFGFGEFVCFQAAEDSTHQLPHPNTPLLPYSVTPVLLQLLAYLIPVNE
jgi:hypothetical protein